ADQGSDGRDAEGPDIGEGLGGHDEGENAPPPHHGAGSAHEERDATRAAPALRSSSVSTPMVASRVSRTRIGTPCSRRRSCSRLSARSSDEWGSEWKDSRTARRYAYMPTCFQCPTSPASSRSKGMGSREK